MLYNTGTIAINGNTATGTGTNWTAPASQVRAGQTIIVMSNPVQMFQISNVNSATSLTVTPAASPALSGQKYGILVSDIISVDGLAQAMSQLIKEYDENIGAWETFATTSANQIITVTINGTSGSIPGIGKLLQKDTNGALAVKDGGTGATTKEDACTNLGLGSSATFDIQSDILDTTSGRVLRSGAFGLGTTRMFTSLVTDPGAAIGYGLAQGTSSPTPGMPPITSNSAHGVLTIPYSTLKFGLVFSYGEMYVGNISATPQWRKVWMEGNTTVDTNGFIKRASPVIKLFGNGQVECNDEAEGITASRVAEGVYCIEGSRGLNPEGWTVEIPQDINGNFLCFVDIATADDGILTVSVFRRRFDVESAMVVAGGSMDIPDGRWIDLRLDMPKDSIWNTKLLDSSGSITDTTAG